MSFSNFKPRYTHKNLFFEWKCFSWVLEFCLGILTLDGHYSMFFKVKLIQHRLELSSSVSVDGLHENFSLFIAQTTKWAK